MVHGFMAHVICHMSYVLRVVEATETDFGSTYSTGEPAHLITRCMPTGMGRIAYVIRSMQNVTSKLILGLALPSSEHKIQVLG